MKEPRLYRDERDLQAMCSLLASGRKANNGTYYIHTGDLNWWLYYPPLEGEHWAHIHLWDDPFQPGQLLGWALISADWVGFDVYVHPELRGSAQAREMYLWAEQQSVQIARKIGRKTIYVLWVLHDDLVLTNHFEKQGYKLKRGYVYLSRKLDEVIPTSRIVDGFEVRGCKGEAEVESRARAQYMAFESSAPFEHYLERFRKFMRSPAYDPDRDIVAVTPGIEIGAFCIVWMDAANRVGLFEPVGTHPDFHRRGLGRAVMLEGLRRMRDRGMQEAIVCTFEDNPAAIKLYESIGFQIVNKLGTFEKDV